MTDKEKFDNRDLRDMTKSQCLSDLDTLRKVFEDPGAVLKEDIDTYRTMWQHLGEVLNVLLIARKSGIWFTDFVIRDSWRWDYNNL